MTKDSVQDAVLATIKCNLLFLWLQPLKLLHLLLHQRSAQSEDATRRPLVRLWCLHPCTGNLLSSQMRQFSLSSFFSLSPLSNFILSCQYLINVFAAIFQPSPLVTEMLRGYLHYQLISRSQTLASRLYSVPRDGNLMWHLKKKRPPSRGCAAWEDRCYRESHWGS